MYNSSIRRPGTVITRSRNVLRARAALDTCHTRTRRFGKYEHGRFVRRTVDDDIPERLHVSVYRQGRPRYEFIIRSARTLLRAIQRQIRTTGTRTTALRHTFFARPSDPIRPPKPVTVFGTRVRRYVLCARPFVPRASSTGTDIRR